MTETANSTMVQVHRVYIKASPQAIWDAITKPEWNEKFGYQVPGEFDLREGGTYRALANQEMRDHGAPEVIIDGEILVCEPPHRLVQTWNIMFEAGTAAEPVTRLTWEIEACGGFSALTVTHELTDAPLAAAFVGGEVPNAGGGWAYVLSDLKSLLETGSAMAG